MKCTMLWNHSYLMGANVQGLSNLIKIRSLRSLLKDPTKPHIKSGDLSIMHDHIVMPRRMLFSDWLNTHVPKQGLKMHLDNL